jgi:general secretion pathway protein J
MKRTHGFTLIELLVALLIMSMLALLGWRTLDGLMRTREVTQQRTQQSARVQVALAQWRTDLNALQVVNGINDTGVSWDGHVLRLIRRSNASPVNGGEAGLWVVAWTLRSNGQNQNTWMRWQSPAQTQNAALQQAWQQAQTWGQSAINDTAAQTALISVRSWNLYYFRNNAWSNSLSSAGNSTTQTTNTMPDAIRLILDVSPDNGMSGPLTLDWVTPYFSNSKS